VILIADDAAPTRLSLGAPYTRLISGQPSLIAGIARRPRSSGSGQGMPAPSSRSAGQEHFGDAQRRRCRRQFHRAARKNLKPFRDQFPPEKLRAIFKDLVDKHAVFDAVVAKPIISDEEAKIDEKGVLWLKGHFRLDAQAGEIPARIHSRRRAVEAERRHHRYRIGSALE